MEDAKLAMSKLDLNSIPRMKALTIARAWRLGQTSLIPDLMDSKTKGMTKAQIDLIKEAIRVLVDLDNMEWYEISEGLGHKVITFDLEEGYLGDPLNWQFLKKDPRVGKYSHSSLNVSFGEADINSLECTRFSCYISKKAFPKNFKMPLELQ